MPLLFSIAPIVLLIWMMTKRNGVPSYLALPLTAAVVYAVQLLWFDASLRLLHANIITALVSTLTPITIIAGAILLNKLMQVSGAENAAPLAGNHQPQSRGPADDYRLGLRLYD